jgi:hypothetical protein
MLNEGYPAATQFGICWNKTGNPVLTDSLLITSANLGAGLFEVFLKNLAPGKSYYVRAFATNNYGTSFGDVQKFTTLELVPNIQYVGPQSYAINSEIAP